MKKIEAPTLNEAYTKASEELGCSILDLDFEIVQDPSKGFLGLFKKPAIIVAKCKNSIGVNSKKQEPKKHQKQTEKPEKKREKRKQEVKREIKQETKKEEFKETKKVQKKKNLISTDVDGIVDVFNSKRDEDILDEIKKDINALFDLSCFNINNIEVSFFDEKTIEIIFNGDDAALLIGKEGYRYKALSYMIFNWINPKYNLLLRLEIAEFLKNQEEQVARYLEPIIENIYNYGKGQTKPLDGVLVQIALKELRNEFPNKYVAIKTAHSGDKFIVVNDFNHSR